MEQEIFEVTEKLAYIGTHDPEGAERLKRLLDRKDALGAGNVYGERFTDRQFSLVFEPLLAAAFGRARILEALAEQGETVSVLSERLGMEKKRVFDHLKELVRKNLVETAGHRDREAIFRRKKV
ncbi:MAG TPA: winged helix-turn-helix domain-containing protein [Syntrophorhabdaceae bacterium]|nr:winged helix-turn-helix domain-containing protein [Syntrophorhabdaceae bacterium]HQM80535.1 winged helix-turn-helix domain-containing protein [Syntrophorhabdaceae bacterium]